MFEEDERACKIEQVEGALRKPTLLQKVGGACSFCQPSTPSRAARAPKTLASKLGVQRGREPSADFARQLLESACGDADKMQEAYGAMRRRLDAGPSSVHLKLAAAEAAMRLIRIKTSSNTLVCRFGRGLRPEAENQCSAENMDLMSKWAPIAQQLINEAQLELGADEPLRGVPDRYILVVETCMYATSSKGIAYAVLSGKALSFLRNVSILDTLYPDFWGAVSCIYWGAYFLAAPWPAQDAEKAKVYFDRALKAFPNSRRNQYWGGVCAFMRSDFASAYAYMQRAIEEGRPPSWEKDCDAFYRAEAEKAMQLIADHGLAPKAYERRK